MKKSRLAIAMLVLVCVALVSMLLFACTDPTGGNTGDGGTTTPPPANQHEPESLGTYLTMVGKAMDNSFILNASKQVGADFDFDLDYVSSTNQDKNFSYRFALKGNLSMGSASLPTDANDVAIVVEKTTPEKTEEIFRLSSDNENIFLRYGDSEGYHSYQFMNAPLFDAIKVLVGEIGADAVLDPNDILDGLFATIIGKVGPFLFDPNDYSYVDAGNRQYLNAKLDLAAFKKGLDTLLGMVDLSALLGGMDLSAIVDQVMAIIPDVVADVTFEMSGGKFLGVTIKDASVSMNDGNEQGVFNFTSNAFKLSNVKTVYGDITPVPANLGDYTQSKLLTADLGGEIHLKNDKGEVYSVLNWKVVADLDPLLMAVEYFDLSAPSLSDNLLHIQIWYDYVEGNTDFGTRRLNQNLTLGDSTSILDIIYAPGQKEYNPGGIMLQVNTANLFTERAVEGIKQFAAEADAAEQLGRGGAWRLISPLFLNTLTVDLDLYTLMYPNISSFQDVGVSATSNTQLASDNPLEGIDIGDLLGKVMGIFSGDTNLGGILELVLGFIPGVPEGIVDSEGIHMAPIVELISGLDLGDIPLDLGAIVEELFAGENNACATLGFTFDKGNMWDAAAPAVKGYDAYRKALYEPDGRDKIFNQSNYLHIFAEQGGKPLRGGEARFLYGDNGGTVGGSPIKALEFEGEDGFLKLYGDLNQSALDGLSGNNFKDALFRPSNPNVTANQGTTEEESAWYISTDDLKNIKYVNATYTMERGIQDQFNNYLEIVGYEGLNLNKSMYGKEQEITLFLNLPETAGTGLLGFLSQGAMINLTGAAAIAGNSPLGIDSLLPLKLAAYQTTTKIIIYEKQVEYRGFDGEKPLIAEQQKLNEELVFESGFVRVDQYLDGKGTVMFEKEYAIQTLADLPNYRIISENDIVNEAGMVNSVGSGSLEVKIGSKTYTYQFNVPIEKPDIPEGDFTLQTNGKEYDYKYVFEEDTGKFYISTNYIHYQDVGSDTYGWGSIGTFELYKNGVASSGKFEVGARILYLYDYENKRVVPHNADKVSSLTNGAVTYSDAKVDNQAHNNFTFHKEGKYWMYAAKEGGHTNGVDGFIFQMHIGMKPKNPTEYTAEATYADDKQSVNVAFTVGAENDADYTLSATAALIGGNQTASSVVKILVDGVEIDASYLLKLKAENFVPIAYNLSYRITGDVAGIRTGYYNITLTLTGSNGQVLEFADFAPAAVGLHTYDGEFDGKDNAPEVDFLVWQDKSSGADALVSYIKFAVSYYEKETGRAIKTSDNVMQMFVTSPLITNEEALGKELLTLFDPNCTKVKANRFNLQFVNHVNIDLVARITVSILGSPEDYAVADAQVFTHELVVAPKSMMETGTVDPNAVVFESEVPVYLGTNVANMPMGNMAAHYEMFISSVSTQAATQKVSISLALLSGPTLNASIVNSTTALPSADVYFNGIRLRYGIENSDASLTTEEIYQLASASWYHIEFKNVVWNECSLMSYAWGTKGAFAIRATINIGRDTYTRLISCPPVL